jgi:aryl-alcohol dehydrogenase-like predicted oxidoreductase
MRTLAVPGIPALAKIGLGTWQFGSREWGYGQAYADREARAIVHRALDLGVTLLDSAEAYAFGRSERILGAALAGRRDEAYVATKLLPIAPFAPVVEQRGRASARRLGVDHIDLYQVHAPNPLVPLATTMLGMRRLLDAGVIGEVGVSNFGLAAWRAAERALGRRVLSDQVSYSLVARGPERDLLPHAAAARRVVIAYSPLAQGLLSGRYDATNAPGGVRATNPLFLPGNLERAAPLLAVLREVAAGHGASPAQVALAWTIRHPNVVAIPGAASVAQLESNAAAADLELAADEVGALTAASDAFSPLRGLRAAGGIATRLARRH